MNRRRAGLALAALVALLPAELRGEDAEDLYRRGDFSAAARAYEERLARDRDARTLLALGNCYARAGELAKAADRYGEALRLEPGTRDGWRNLGRVLYRAGRYAEAATALARGCGESPDTNELRLYASALALAGDGATAVLALEKAALLAPSDARVRLDLGAAYERARRFPEAIRAYRAAQALEPAATAAWEGLGHAHAAAGESDEAIVALEVSARLGGADRGSLALLGDLELGAGLADASAQAYERATSQGTAPEPEDLERLGVARQREGDPARALEAFDAALAREPRRGRARLARAESLDALGRREEARAALAALAQDADAGPWGEAARARLEARR